MSDAFEGQSRKVIAFDSWTGGAVNIERLVEAFARRGLDLFLIHIGSWGHDQGRPKEERIGRLLVRDINYYGRMSFKELLELERPAAVLFLSIQAFAHRAFNRYCAQIGIPTLHLYHGLINVQSTTALRLNPLNLQSQVALAVRRLGKNLGRLWPVYARALSETRAPLRDWFWFAYDVWRQVAGRSYSGQAAPDASTTACCLYTEADVDHAVKRYRMLRKAVVAVGNPDLVRFRITEDNLGACLSPAWVPSKDVMYIDTALIEAGAVFDNARDFSKHMLTTKQALAKQGFDLIVKLHPAHFRTRVPELLEQNGVEVCENEDFMERLKNCRGCIVESSSLSVIPALMGMPLFLAQYGKLREQRYGDVLTSYPRARLLTDLQDLSSLLAAEESSWNAEPTFKWIGRNAGPLPAEEMPVRVAEIMASLIRERVQSQPDILVQAQTDLMQ